ncbi:uncharacterized protein LOC114243479 [Bombyx mandarina]|uniref:Uncharacterized protein LOC114243479 n=1 Tax=Bombyx mandarina TaxID=7092 RepID=A0A6J2JP38_BOMMA|nr:uncharacterized protein LOC114243479 [Bombyx mandarina]
MKMDNWKQILPQEGTSRSAGGESLRASEQSEARCPSYSGGGNNCQEEGGGSTSRERERIPLVQPERCDSALSLRSTQSSARGCASSGRESPLFVHDSAGLFVSRNQADPRARRKRKSVKRPAAPAPSESSEVEPAPAKFLAVEEGLVNAAALPPIGCEPTRNLTVTYGEPVVTTPVRTSASRRRDAAHVREGEVERLSRSLIKEMEATDPRGTFVVSKEIVSAVATKSGSLKGTYVQALNRVATAVETRLDDLLKRTSTDEVISLRLQMEQLQALYTSVQVENAELRAESARVREEMARMRVVLDDVVGCQGSSASPPPVRSPQEATDKDREIEELKRCLAIMEARTSTVERARPPLAHERPLPTHATAAAVVPAPTGAAAKVRMAPATRTVRSSRAPAKPAGRRTPAQPTRPQAAASAPPQAAASAPPQPAKVGPGRSRKKRERGVNAAETAPIPQPRPLPPAPSNMDEAWNTVVRRGRRKAAAPSTRTTPAVASPQAMGRATTGGGRKGRKVKKPRAPRSAAVVLELLPAGKEKGLTYGEVMARARGSVDVDAIGVEGGLRVRQTASGARLLVCPSADSGAAADRLAARLREILPNPEVVRIDRHVKMAEIKVTGLDECATKEEVAAAIASQGNCALAQVKVGEPRSCYSGSFTVWARCPVQVATLLATPPQGRPADSPGRLRVGWVIAHVQLQEARPWRCLRCFGTGHGLAKCPSAVDRSGLCFRCGQAGHKAASCSAATPHCVLCDAAKRRADHRAM